MINSLANFGKQFQLRQNIIPFEGAFALFSIYSGIISIADFGVVANIIRDNIGRPLSTLFDVVLMLAGFGVYIGIGFSRRDFEAAGLILMISSLLIRIVLISNIIGFNPIIFNNYIFNGIFIITCAIRLNSIFRGHIIIRLEDSPTEAQLKYVKSHPIIKY